MKTYIENGTDTSVETEAAINRSVSRNEIARVFCIDQLALVDWITENYSDVDYARENDGDLDVWGKCSGDDFRVRVGKMEE